eukprot:3654563-Amphidinium_carterae.1
MLREAQRGFSASISRKLLAACAHQVQWVGSAANGYWLPYPPQTYNVYGLVPIWLRSQEVLTN